MRSWLMMTMVTMEMITETNHNTFNGLNHFAICCCFFCGVSVAITWIYLVIGCGDDKFVIFFRTYCQFYSFDGGKPPSSWKWS